MVAEQILFDVTKLSIENPVVQSAIVGLVRGVAGWAENAFEDGKISAIEFSKLGETVFRVIPQALGLTALFGPAGTVGALATDYIIHKFKK